MTTSKGIANLRQEYAQHILNEECVNANPIEQFRTWFDEALKAEIKEPNAMALGTVSKDGLPSVRIVLLKGFDDRGFVFFSNYNSHKAQDLEANPHAAITFLWLGLERQIRIEGKVEKVSAAESDEYFNSRPFGSRLGAWSSPQSQEISKQELIDSEESYKERFTDENSVPRPPHWGGYRIIPNKIEFWQGRPSRMHDRILYTLNADGSWKLSRLAP